jgi:hypothetical protein
VSHGSPAFERVIGEPNRSTLPSGSMRAPSDVDLDHDSSTNALIRRYRLGRNQRA